MIAPLMTIFNFIGAIPFIIIQALTGFFHIGKKKHADIKNTYYGLVSQIKEYWEIERKFNELFAISGWIAKLTLLGLIGRYSYQQYKRKK